MDSVATMKTFCVILLIVSLTSALRERTHSALQAFQNYHIIRNPAIIRGKRQALLLDTTMPIAQSGPGIWACKIVVKRIEKAALRQFPNLGAKTTRSSEIVSTNKNIKKSTNKQLYRNRPKRTRNRTEPNQILP